MKQDLPDSTETSFITPNARWFSRPADNRNHKKNKAGPCRRWGHSTAIADNRLFIYGGTGYNSNARFWESIYQLDLENWDWTKLEPVNKVPNSRDSHSCIVYNNKLYIFGGSSGNDSKNDMYEYDLTANTWKKVEEKGTVPSPREGHAACLLDNRYMVIYGGWNGEETFDNCYLFDIPQKTWIYVEKMSGVKPTSRESQSCCMVRRDMYFFGGQGNSIVKDGENLDNFHNDLYRLRIRFDDETKMHASATWDLIEPRGPKPLKRSSHSSCAYKDRYVFIIGGEGYPPNIDEEKEPVEYRRVKNDENGEEYPCFPKNDVWAYDVEMNNWFKVNIKNEADFVPRFAHSNVIYKEFLVIFGGLHDYHHSTNDIHVLSLSGENPFQLKAIGKGGKDDGMEEENLYQSHSENTSVLQAELEVKEKEPSKALIFNKQDSLLDLRKDLVEPPPFEGVPLLDRPVLSTNFLCSLSSMMSWPLAAFGLLLDNAVITGAKDFSINYLVKQKKRNVKDILEDGNANGEKSSINTPYLLIEDDGVGWKPEDFIKILTTYDADIIDEETETEAKVEGQEEVQKIEEEEKKEQTKEEAEEKKRKDLTNEYGLNLKVASVRLGRNIIFLSRNGDEISLGFLTADKRLNPNLHRHHTFYYSWRRSTGEYLTNRAEKNRSIIRNALAGMFTLEDLASGIEKIGTRVVIFDLVSTLGPALNRKGKGDPELLFVNKMEPHPVNDLMVRTLDKSLRPFYQDPSVSVIELSLRTYLSYFFLNTKKNNINISLNGTLIEQASLQESLSKATDSSNNIHIIEEQSFDGVINQSSAQNNLNGEKKSSIKITTEEILGHQTLNQGVLIYHKNRLIRRLENSKMGNLDFLSAHFSKFLENRELNPGKKFFDKNGYIELAGDFKPNIFKTELENPFYSNYLHGRVMSQLVKREPESLNVKRPSPQEIFEEEEIKKKVKLNPPPPSE